MADEVKEEKAPEEPGKAPEPTAPQAESGEAKKEQQVPEKFKDKSQEEILKSYQEAEKELGRLRNQVGESEKLKDTLKQWEQLGGFIQGNPALYKALEEEIKQKTGQSNGEVKRDDTRTALLNNQINDFERRFGIESLEGDKRAELHKKIGDELAEMLDPGGSKTYNDIIDEIPLDRVPRYLEKAYRLATINDTAEKARLEGLIQARQNNEASFGNIPASSSKSDGVQLTPDERTAAKRMKVSEEQYLKNKKALEEGK